MSPADWDGFLGIAVTVPVVVLLFGTPYVRSAMWGLVALIAVRAVTTDWTGVATEFRAHGVDPDRVILVPLAVAAVSGILLVRGARRGWAPPTRQLDAL